MRRIYRLLLLTAIGLFVITIGYKKGVFKNGMILGKTVRAVGNLIIDYGVPAEDPIFTISNMLPGDSHERTITITNNGSHPYDIGIQAALVSETKFFAQALSFVLNGEGSDIYGGSANGPKTVQDFIIDSSVPQGITLLSIDPGQTHTYTITIAFEPDSANEFQNASLVFDISIGYRISTPSECSQILIDGEYIYGTDKKDNLVGTDKNDVIYGYGGKDYISGSGGSDCIIGGKGKDLLFGGSGDDVILAEEGNDYAIGDYGNDAIYGGGGKDILRGSHGDDYIEGNGMNDIILGDDGDDTLIGGSGSDYTDGGAGTDSCEAELMRRCE